MRNGVAAAAASPARNTLRRVRIVGDLIMCISRFSPRSGIYGVRHTDGIKREAEAIGRWCRRYVGISPRDERHSRVRFRQGDQQRANPLAQPFEDLVNERL